MKLRDILNGGIGTRIMRSRYGPLLIVAGGAGLWVGLHLVLLYELRTGIMLWRLGPVEGRQGAPILYWINIAGIALAALTFDTAIAIAALHDRRERKRNQPPKPRRP